MRLVEKKCPNCGGELKFSFEDKETTCEFCGRSFEIERDENIDGDNEEIFNAEHYALTEEQKKVAGAVLGSFAIMQVVPIIIIAFFVIGIVLFGVFAAKSHKSTGDDHSSFIIEKEKEEDPGDIEQEVKKTAEERLKEQGYVMTFEDLKDNHLKDIHENTLSILNKYVKEHSTWFYSHDKFSFVGMYLLTNSSGNTLYDVCKMNFKVKGKNIPYFTAVKYDNAKVKDGKLVLNMSGSMLPFSMSMDSGGHATLGYESAKDFYNKVIRGLLEKSTVYSIGGVYKE